MEKIGEFAKRCQTTIKTLRYYDRLGLLIPDSIDTFTGYRYYGMGKVMEMRRITELKYTGFSLDEIKRYCNAVSDDERNRIIEEKHLSLIKLAEDTAHQLKKLESIKRNLWKGEIKMPISKNLPFENDERVIGHWDFITAIDKKENFKPENKYDKDTVFEELYFLPGGEKYWGFGWTKNYLKITFGDGLLCPYEISDINGGQYMFIEHNDIDKNNFWVLKQINDKHYTRQEIGVQDDINLPFATDETVIGVWDVADFIDEIEKFNPAVKSWTGDLWYIKAEFLPDGTLHNSYNKAGPFTQNMKWTKGKTLLKSGDGTSAPAYEIRNLGGTDYLFIEWKSGDYIWGKRKPSYYVFTRSN